MNKVNSNFSNALVKITFFQLALLLIPGLIFIYFDEYNIGSALIICGLTTAIYTQLIKLSTNNHLLALFGFPLRIAITGTPCAILVHKLHSNLIALFIGFVISEIVFFYFIYRFAREEEG